MDECSKHIQAKVLWCMLLADSIVSVEKTEGVNAKFKIWRNTLESKGFRISRVKTKYMKCKFSKNIKCVWMYNCNMLWEKTPFPCQ